MSKLRYVIFASFIALAASRETITVNIYHFNKKMGFRKLKKLSFFLIKNDPDSKAATYACTYHTESAGPTDGQNKIRETTVIFPVCRDSRLLFLWNVLKRSH